MEKRLRNVTEKSAGRTPTLPGFDLLLVLDTELPALTTPRSSSFGACFILVQARPLGQYSDSLCKAAGRVHTSGMPLAEKLDPLVLALLNAPIDDEPTTEEDLRAVAEANASLAAGDRTYTVEELAREWNIDL